MRCVLAIITARGGSKRLPGKNLIALAGKPLIDYTIAAACGAHSLYAIALSTDSPEIARHATTLGVAIPALRPPEFAQDASPLVDALRHALLAWESDFGRADAVVALQPTSPFRTSAQIDDAVTLFESSGADTVTAVRPVADHPWWTWVSAGDFIQPMYPDRMVTERSALTPVFVESGAIYVIRRDLIVSGQIYGDRVVPYPTDAMTSVDIDTAEDLAWAEFLLARRDVPGAR